MKSFYKALTMVLTLSSISCSSEAEMLLTGLWQSNVEKSEVLVEHNESLSEQQRDVVNSELGKLYHHFSGDEFYLIYSPSLDPEAVLEMVRNENLKNLSDGEFAKRFEIVDVERINDRINITLDGSNGSSSLVLDLDNKHECYQVDNSQYGDFTAEVFCKIDIKRSPE